MNYLNWIAFVTTIIIVASSSVVNAQNKPFVEYPENVSAYLKRIQTGTRSNRFDKGKDFNEWQNSARAGLIELIGLNKMATELNGFVPNVTLGLTENIKGKYSRSLCTIETEPGTVVPFYLLQPTKTKGQKKLPLILCPHGHDAQGLHSYAGSFKDEEHRKNVISREGNIAEQAALRGLIAIAPATRGLAKEITIPDPKGRHGNRPCRAQLMHCLVAGRTPTGERVWDMQRILDWASALPQVDPKRILMTGNSGGGVLTAYMAAIDTRISVAIPSCSFTSVTSSEGFIFHCDCCIVPGLRDWGDWTEIGGLVAPRHLLIVHGISDGLHNRKDVERTAKQVQSIFRNAGHPERMAMKWGSSGHRFYPDLMWPFIDKAIY